MKTQYTPEYFIKKFEAIPDQRWVTKKFTDSTGKRHCALGHCGASTTRRGDDFITVEASSLDALFEGVLGLTASDVNDRKERAYTQPTPKQRILAALRDIAEMEKK